MCASLPFGFEGGTWGLNVLNPDHCFSIYSVSMLQGYLSDNVCESASAISPAGLKC